MIYDFTLVCTGSQSPVRLDSLNAVPGVTQSEVPFSELSAVTNFDALEAAIPNDAMYYGLAQSAALIIAGVVYGLTQYIALGLAPKRICEGRVVGERKDGEWLFFIPSCGMTMTCDDSLTFESQVFELLPSYLADASSALSNDAPWYYRQSFVASAFGVATQTAERFWALHKKTAEII